ncbi:MAG: hypothetical protein IKZ88_07020 [Neisseriaceae bacterium]|nr:hypothetical protein [Neisseriaceae bacterium]
MCEIPVKISGCRVGNLLPTRFYHIFRLPENEPYFDAVKIFICKANKGLRSNQGEVRASHKAKLKYILPLYCLLPFRVGKNAHPTTKPAVLRWAGMPTLRLSYLRQVPAEFDGEHS